MPRLLRETPSGVKRYQLMVKAKDPKTGVEKDTRVGPILQIKSILEDHAAVINKAVAEGREKEWRDARVIEIDKIETVH